MDFLIFNELSYPFKDKYEANAGIKTFIQTFSAASKAGLNRLRLHERIGENLYNLELAPGYHISHWLHAPMVKQEHAGEDDRVNDDLKERFKEIFTGSPLITDQEPIEKDIDDRSTFQIFISNNGSSQLKNAEGLGAAFLLDTIALSFLSGAFWDTRKLQNLNHYLIKEDGSDVEEVVDVLHAARPGHIEYHTDWLEKKKRESLTAARELWERREKFFPHLVLCGNVERQLTTNVGIGSKYFNQIIERLKRLDAFSKDWTTGSFSDKELSRYGLDVSGESEQTMRKYGRERRCRLPDGRREYFEKHIKTGALRFHFYPDEENHHIYIGYIGPHLRTITG